MSIFDKGSHAKARAPIVRCTIFLTLIVHCNNLSNAAKQTMSALRQSPMTFDQAQDAFRKHKTYETAGFYLSNAIHDQADDTIGGDIFFDAVGEVASWLSASDEQLRGLEAVRARISIWRK
jgi:hypothetical protein